jgi:hypothetical protein
MEEIITKETFLLPVLAGIINQYTQPLQCVYCGKNYPFDTPPKRGYCNKCCPGCHRHDGSHGFICQFAPGACKGCHRHDESHGFICQFAPGACKGYLHLVLAKDVTDTMAVTVSSANLHLVLAKDVTDTMAVTGSSADFGSKLFKNNTIVDYEKCDFRITS